MLEKLEESERSQSPLIYRSTGKDGAESSEKLFVDYTMVKCLLCLLYVFGRRIRGVLRLKREDFWSKRGYLYVRFTVLKKARRKDELKPRTRVKRINVKKQWKYARHILDYISTIKDPEANIFPGRSRAHVLKVKRRGESGEILKTYRYEMTASGLMSRQRAYKIIKALNPNVYPHWFRHSLATQLAEEGIDAWQLMNWFDWDRFGTAKRYVAGTAAMTRDISNREIG
jgi:integrase